MRPDANRQPASLEAIVPFVTPATSIAPEIPILSSYFVSDEPAGASNRAYISSSDRLATQQDV
jgi:hypothetical protein